MAWRQCILSAIEKQEFVAWPTDEKSAKRCFLSAHLGDSSEELFTTGRPILVVPAYADHRESRSSIFRDATAYVGFDLRALLRTGFDGGPTNGPCGKMLPVEHAPRGHLEPLCATEVRPLLRNAAEGRRVQ